jgi:hypothetical protein
VAFHPERGRKEVVFFSTEREGREKSLFFSLNLFRKLLTLPTQQTHKRTNKQTNKQTNIVCERCGREEKKRKRRKEEEEKRKRRKTENRYKY